VSALAAGGGLGVVIATLAANAVSGGGPDLIGIAAVITAISGLLGTLVMAYLALRRRRDDVPLTPEGIADAVREGLREASHGDPGAS
jgi:hypothetical protein